MSSILTNNGAMVALQTLKSINNDLNKTQSMISTGKNITNAKDNAAIWAISKVMEADMRGFKGISDSLSLGQSTVALARQGAETVTDLLTQMKEKIVAAQESNVDRAKIQTDISALRSQISSVVGAAQFNGLNLLQTTDWTQPSAVNVLSSLDRSGTGVAASDINVRKIDLSASKIAFTLNSGGTSAATTASNLAILEDAANTGTVTMSGTVNAGQIYTLNIGATNGFTSMSTLRTHSYVVDTPATLAQSQKFMYVAKTGDTAADVTSALLKKFNAAKDGVTAAGGAAVPLTLTQNANGSIAVSGTGITATAIMSVQIGSISNVGNVRAEGGLGDLSDISVTTEAGVDAGLTAIEGMIQKAVDAAASFGSIEKRIETQGKFVSSLMDSLKAGIGTLVDANMEEASARLQALQVQQQLGIQALSIANQAPQSLLSLFRG